VPVPSQASLLLFPLFPLLLLSTPPPPFRRPWFWTNQLPKID
jgi:hypothetical protein